MHAGQAAAPEALEFAKFLSWNTTQTANVYQSVCFNYTSTSSSALDAFSNEITGVVSMLQAFLTSMETYANPASIAHVKLQVESFAVKAEREILGVIYTKVQAAYNNSAEEAGLKTLGAMAVASEDHEVLELLQETTSDNESVFEEMAATVNNFMGALPNSITALKTARVEASRVVGFMDSIFSVFQRQGWSTFDMISFLYRRAWIAYFIFLVLLQVAILFYAFWSSGFCGGPRVLAEEEDKGAAVFLGRWQQPAHVFYTSSSHKGKEFRRPDTFKEQCFACCTSCCACFSGCNDSALCFWSVILLLQVSVLFLFALSTVVCALFGIHAFIRAGCSEVYMLNHHNPCTEVMVRLKSWLPSFQADASMPLEEWCTKKDLVTCGLMEEKMAKSLAFTTVFSVVGAILCFHLVVESSVLHEGARMRCKLEELGVN